MVTPDHKPAGDFVFIALTPGQYENLARNQAEVTRWVREARSRIDICTREDK